MMKETKKFTGKERQTLKDVVAEKTGYIIVSNAILIQAFTRSSYSAVEGGENNEVLEFIGDRVLDFYVTKSITKRFGARGDDGSYSFRVRENRFTEIKSEITSNKALAKIVDEWDIVKYLVVGKSDLQNNVGEQEKVKADLFEAILGAIATATNWNSEILERAVSKMLSIEDALENIVITDYRPVEVTLDNAINTLNEMAGHHICDYPTYEITGPENLGYDEEGNPKWHCACAVGNLGITRGVLSNSKKISKKAAAYLVLCDHFELQNEYGSNSKLPGWTWKDGQLVVGWEL